MDLLDVAQSTIRTRLKFVPNMMDNNGSLAGLSHQYLTGSVTGDSYFMDLPNALRAIIVVTPVGNVVVQEVSRDASYVLCHAPKLLHGLCGNGKLTDEQIAPVIGLWGNQNIGEVLGEVIKTDMQFNSSLSQARKVRA